LANIIFISHSSNEECKGLRAKHIAYILGKGGDMMSIKKEYLIKKSNQQRIIVGINEHNHIFTCTELNPMDKEIISKDKILDYSIDIDTHDNLHMVTLNSAGELKYYLNQGKTWGSKIISKFDIKSNNYKYMKIFALNHGVHLIYSFNNLLQPGLWTVKHSMFAQGKWKNFRVCDIFSGKYMHPFIVDKDSKNNLYVAFKGYSKSENDNHIYMSKFNSSYQVWSSPEKVSGSNISNNNPFLYIDKTNNLHICWSSIIKNNLQVCYSYKDSSHPKASWSEPKTITENNTNCLNPIMYEYDDVLYIFWIQGDGLYYKSSKDKGTTWSKAIAISVKSSINIIQYQHMTKLDEISNELKNCCFYGYWEERVKPLGIEENTLTKAVLSNSPNLSHNTSNKKDEEPEIKPPILSEKNSEAKLEKKVTYKTLETRVLDIEQTIKEILSSISSLENNYDKIISKLDDISTQHNITSEESEKIRRDYNVLNHQLTDINSSIQAHIENISSINSQYIDVINNIQLEYQKLNILLEQNVEASTGGLIKKIKDFIKIG